MAGARFLKSCWNGSDATVIRWNTGLATSPGSAPMERKTGNSFVVNNNGGNEVRYLLQRNDSPFEMPIWIIEKGYDFFRLHIQNNICICSLSYIHCRNKARVKYFFGKYIV